MLKVTIIVQLNIIKNHSDCNYVADTRTGFENHPVDTKWVADVFMPTAAEYGCKTIWFIIDKENSLKEELEDCRNALCYKCGEYKMRHKGACDGCRWKQN